MLTDYMEESVYIENFGPIKKAEVLISKVTLLIGRQGTGKSAVAKLYSMFSWLEKSLMRHSLTIRHIEQYSRFRKEFCAYNNMEDYFKDDTVLRFNGVHFLFVFQNGELSISAKGDTDTLSISKVMYIPAERNILGSTDYPSRIKGLNRPMQTFSEEFAAAKINYKTGYIFPFENVKFEYDALNDLPKLRQNGDFEIRLSAGSSGFQSSLPMLLVSKNLTEMVRASSSHSELSPKERNALQREVMRIMEDKSLSEDVRIVSLRSVSSRFRYSRFVNIVEEMELNLFPDSQRGTLYELLAEVNTLSGNRLMLTTHSPYVVNYLTLAIKASELWEKAKVSDNKDTLTRISNIVPECSQIAFKDVAIYEMEDGTVRKLADCDGIPSDDNYLNTRLNDTNIDYDALLEIEDNI